MVAWSHDPPPSPTHGHMTSTLGRERERMREMHGGGEKWDREEGKGRKKGEMGQGEVLHKYYINLTLM